MRCIVSRGHYCVSTVSDNATLCKTIYCERVTASGRHRHHRGKIWSPSPSTIFLCPSRTRNNVRNNDNICRFCFVNLLKKKKGTRVLFPRNSPPPFSMKAPSGVSWNPAVSGAETQVNSAMHDSARPTAIVRCVLSAMFLFLTTVWAFSSCVTLNRHKKYIT